MPNVAHTTGMLLSLRDAALAQIGQVSNVARGNQAARTSLTDMYSGTPGLALFLGYLGSVIEDAESTSRARALIAGLKHAYRSQDFPVGAFIGAGALVYLYAHLGALWNDSDLLGDAASIVNELKERRYDESPKDIVSGLAGLILALESLYLVRPSTEIVSLVATLANELIRTAIRQKVGVGWACGPAQTIATGFAHGAAGCAAALCVAHELTGDLRYLRFSQAAFDFESSLYVPEWSNWPDAIGGLDMTYPFINTSWCWGSAGLALARLRVRRQLLSSQSLIDAQHALLATVAYGFSARPQCLCHGRAGSVDTLREAGRMLAEPLWTNVAQVQSAYLETAIVQGGLCCELKGHAVKNSIGLMTGFVGVAYALLRSLAPDQVPCVLSLSPPMSQERPTFHQGS